MLDRAIELSDGRTLAFLDLGDPDGAPVLFFHGAPSCRFALEAYDDAFRVRGVRVVAADRPGYGGSTPCPGRTLESSSGDVAALAEALGIRRCWVAGHSSGGPYAVVCASLLGDLIAGAAVIAGVTDMAWKPAWDAWRIPLEAELMRAPTEAAAIDRARQALGESRNLDLGDIELPEADIAYLSQPGVRLAMASRAEETFRQGVAGYAVDAWVQGQPWAFDPGLARGRVRVFHGASDTILPVEHSQHTAWLTGTQVELLEGHGHLSVMDEFPRIFAEMAAMRGV